VLGIRIITEFSAASNDSSVAAPHHFDSASVPARKKDDPLAMTPTLTIRLILYSAKKCVHFNAAPAPAIKNYTAPTPQNWSAVDE
jgi:hypothetical protein